MAFRQLQSLVKRLRKDRLKDQQKHLRRSQVRRALSERLEDRRMFAGPELLAIRPDSGALLRDGDTLNAPPREFNLLFKGGANLDEATISASTIRLFRSGGDGEFTNDQVEVALGYVGLVNPGDTSPDNLQKIVLRPANAAPHNATDPSNAFPDDTYQIQIVGAGAQALRNLSGEAFNDAETLNTTFRLDRGAQVISVVPQPVSRNTQRLTIGATGGSYRLLFNGEITSVLQFNSSSGAIQNALRSLNSFNDTDVSVQTISVAGNTRVVDITFQGQYAGEQVPLLGVFNDALSGGIASVARSNALTQASNQIVVHFDNQQLNAAEVIDPKFYRLTSTAGSLTPNDDVVLLPQVVTYDRTQNSVVLTFANAIPEGNYRLDVGKSGGNDNTLATALVVGALSDGNPFITNQFLGDSGSNSLDPTDIDLFKFDLRNGAMLNVALTAIPPAAGAPALGLRARLLDRNGVLVPGTTVTTTSNGTALLTTNITSTQSYFLEIVSSNGQTGSYRINASVTGSPIVVNDSNSFIGNATAVGTVGAGGITVSSQIQPQSIPLPPLPGGEDEPGHRRIQRETHINSIGTTATVPLPTKVIEYYFPDSLGTDPAGNNFPNFLTATERQIVRDIFEVYAKISGYEFIETQGVGELSIGKGNLQAINPTIDNSQGVRGLQSDTAIVLNNTVFNQADRFYGDVFTLAMYHEIGHKLGLGHSFDQPSIMGSYDEFPAQGNPLPNNVLPGDVDVIHLQRIAPPNSTDVDMFSFKLEQAGRFTAETVAERLPNPSQLNSVLTLYRRLTGGELELVARNDQYFGADAFLELTLTAGDYFIGVSSVGNENYDPRVPDSGFGGTTDGAYELKLNFVADRNDLLRDSSDTAIDGDANGTPGGVFSFWFQASDQASTIYVDKASTAVFKTGAIGQPYDTINTAFTAASNRILIPRDATAAGLIGQRFIVDDGINAPVTFTYSATAGAGLIQLLAADTPATIATKTRTAIESAKTAGSLRSSVTATVTDRIVQFTGIDQLDLGQSPTLLNTPNLVRIVGNGGNDLDITTTGDNRPYLIGFNTADAPLADGAEFLVPQGVTVMVDAGALFKMRRANLDVGTSAPDVNRSQGALQLLGTPQNSVFIRSFNDDTIGGNSNGTGPGPASGDFGGVVFRNDSDLEAFGIFLNYVNHTDIHQGGGKVFVGPTEASFSSIHIDDARPTVSFNRITSSATAAISASPDSFDDSIGRVGPDVDGNFLVSNSIDGLFIRIETPLASSIDKLTVSGRFDDTGITHVISENLIIAGAGGGLVRLADGTLQARPAGRLVIDPGTVVKLNKARIEAERGAGYVIAEGTPDAPIIFTSLSDDRFGGSGSFNSDLTVAASPARGNWGGLFFGEMTSGSIAHSLISFGGGITPIEGGAAAFNAIEIHQSEVRISNTQLVENASGAGTSVRNGRGVNGSAVIYVRGAQPIIVDNIIEDNSAAAININANALNFVGQRDGGLSRGEVTDYEQFDANHGPMVRLNRLENNTLNGMLVRGEMLTTESIWDDTDIVHILQNLITVDNLHTYGGLTIQSSASESLVVKLSGAGAGFTATGSPTDIIDRIGGTIHVLGTVGHPVIFTSLTDDSVGAGFTPSGTVNTNTNNSATPSTGTPGAWRGFLFTEFSNDRNVAVVRELENPLTNRRDTNGTPADSQLLGNLAPNQKSGDENSRLGFEVKGFISPNDPNDIDVYSFVGVAGTNVWIDIDRTDTALDAIIEVINPLGTVVARSVRSSNPTAPNALGADGSLNAQTMTQNEHLGGDHYTTNFRDPGLFFQLPLSGTYFVRIRSNPRGAGSITTFAGESRGAYQLQIRLQQENEFPGSTIQFADIRFAQTGIDVRGLPKHSPLVAEAGELEGDNGSFDASQSLVNLLQSDIAALGLSGVLSSETDADWYRFDLTQTEVQTIGGINMNSGTIAVVFDMDYAAQLSGDTTIAVYNSNRQLIYVGRESNVQDDQPLDNSGNINDLTRGSLGNKDPYIGPIHLIPGQTYFVAVMSDRLLPTALTGAYFAAPANPANALVRLEPINSLYRVVEDHLGPQGFTTQGNRLLPLTPGGLFDISTPATLANHVRPFTFGDVQLYVATDSGADSGDSLYTVNPFAGRILTQVSSGNSFVAGENDVQDIVIRSDGRMFGYQRQNAGTTTGRVGALVELDPSTGAIISTQPDNIDDQGPTPNTGSLNPNLGTHLARAEQFTTSNEVDALTFRRRSTTGTSSAPVPVYETYYAVRESATSSKLYRGRQNGDAAPAIAAGGEPRYGVMGHIQPAGVTFASRTIGVSDNATNPAFSFIRIESKLPGSAGNSIVLNISRPNNTAATVTSVVGTTINLNIGATGGPPPTGAPSAAAIVDAINNSAAGALVTAVIVGGNANGNGDGNNGTVALNVFNQGFGPASGPLSGGSIDSVVAPLTGRVTGLSYANLDGTGDLYGVTNAGEFLRINASNGTVLTRVDMANSLGEPGLNFQGLALGPQNVEGGRFANTLFAVTSDGRLVAFDTAGNGVLAFDSATSTSSQLINVNSGTPNGGFFTLTFENGGSRETTAPISVNAPSTVSINETQSLDTNAFGGTFTLSYVDDQPAITSPVANIPTSVTGNSETIVVENGSAFPATPFVIRVQNEEMLVTARSGNSLTVTRGHNSTTVTAHPDTATVSEVVFSRLATSLVAPVQSTLAAPVDLSSPGTVTVANAAAFPAVPYTIRINNEEMVVTAIAGNQLTVLRAQNGTSIAQHATGGIVRVVSDSLTVVDGTPYPALGSLVRINNEDIRVLSRTGNVLEIIRGANATTPATHAAGSDVLRLNTTTPLPFNATAGQIRTALGALPGIGGVANVNVSFGPLSGTNTSPVTIEFTGALAARNIRPLTADRTRLLGNEVQQLTLNTNVTAGTFRLSFLGQQTAPIAFNATPGAVQAALEALPNIGTGNVVVTGPVLPTGTLNIEFVGSLRDADVAQLNIVGNLLRFNERQQLVMNGGPTGGTFTLTLNNPANGLVGTTGALPFNATADLIRTELENTFPALVGNIIVTGGPFPGAAVIVEFAGAFAGVDIAQMSATSTLTGGTAPSVGFSTLPNPTPAAEATTLRQGQPVSVTVTQGTDGILSVRDALLALPSIGPNDIRAAGILQGAGVLVNFQGQFANVVPNAFIVDGFLLQNTTQATVTVNLPTPNAANSFISSQIPSLVANPIGLAFSPLDFNLWHTTNRRGGDAGHGINASPDGTRAGSGGGTSMHFGFEAWDINRSTYDAPIGLPNRQFGIRTPLQHQDLSSNGELVNSYNFPGGAHGTLTTNTFSLANAVAADRPTLYFNYFLDTENHPGSDLGSDGNDPFRDSARVFASTDGGLTWNLLVTNNSQLSADFVPSIPGTAELPGFLSHLSDAGLNSGAARPESHQIVQEMMDSTGQWRQARVDLSTYAGQNVMLRFDFATAGAMNDPTLGGTDAGFGEFSSLSRSIRSLNNRFEGFYIDDLIVGFAERGEMVTGTVSDAGLTNLFAGGLRTRDDDPAQFPDPLDGPYQLEIRRAGEYQQLGVGGNLLATQFHTNDRHILEGTMTANVTFDPAPVGLPLAPVATTLAGTFFPANAISPWQVSSVSPFTGTRSLQSGPIGFGQAASIFQATAAQLGSASNQAGIIRFAYRVDSEGSSDGLRFFINGIPQRFPQGPTENIPGAFELASGNTDYRIVEFPFGSAPTLAGNDVVFSWMYDARFVATAGTAFIDDIQIIQGGTGLLADRNRDRAQGIFNISSNFIRNSSVRAINVEPGTTQAGGSVPHPGSVINFPQQNTDRLVPGVVIQNNVLVGGSGIRFAGETAQDPQRPVPFGRIVNNTITGRDQNGIGIEVVGLASPTLLNNVLTNLATGIVDTGVNTVVRANFFQSNGANGTTGTDALSGGTTGSPFVNAGQGNYYLVPGSSAVDRAQETEQDRFDHRTFKRELGIPESPIKAPLRDVYGQLRIDSSSSPGGGGASVFIDRGAVDRSDIERPYATLLNPIDNDSAGQDRDPNATVVHLTSSLLENFSILLGDGRGPNFPFQGTGVNSLTVSDPSNPTVSQGAVKVFHNNVELVQGVDYNLGYNTTTGVLLLTPLSSLWDPSGVYTIALDNTQIVDLAGNRLSSNQPDGSTKFFILMPDVRLDFGDAPASYGTLLGNDGARHTIQVGATPRLGGVIDSEATGIVAVGGDDLPQLAVISNASPLFTVPPGQARLIVTTAAIMGGEQVTVQIGTRSATFELVRPGFAAQRGNVAIPLATNSIGTITDTPSTIASKLVAAMTGSLVLEGNAATVAIDATLSNVVNITTLDDEDGVGVGTFTKDGTSYTVFLQPGSSASTTDPADVLGFLNPLDPQGASISITATGAGFVDGWIDYNGNGTFEITEKLFNGVPQPVVAGVNTLRIFTPANTANRTTWARFRISDGGQLDSTGNPLGYDPTGLAIGGEVEDYQVQIINIPLPTPIADTFTVDEDTVLNTEANLSFPSLIANDTIPAATFLTVRYFVGQQPTNGTLVVTDPTSGRFIYTPAPDFSGVDTFTYRLSTQPTAGTNVPPSITFATVTINVRPINDAPSAVNKAFTTTEDTSVTITAAQLIANSLPDANAQFPAGNPAAPWNESNQTLRIVSIQAGATVITAADAANGPFTTARGRITARFAADNSLIDVTYTPNQDLNRDNVSPLSLRPILDSFLFTVQDDGILVDQGVGLPPVTRLTATATATIDVAPQNDAPTINPDTVSVGIEGTTNTVTPWSTFFTNLGQTVPVPTEDTALTIPAAYLLANDLAGRTGTSDENGFVNGNDGAMTITGVTAVTPGLLVSLDLAGNVVLTPPANVYGQVVFTYTAVDQGVNEAVDGTRTPFPLSATGTVTVTLQPVNDAPVTFDRSLSFTESANAGTGAAFTFNAARLITGTNGETPSVAGNFAQGLGTPFNEVEQALRVVAFRTSAGTVDVSSLTGGNGTLTLASDEGGTFRFTFVNGAFTTGEYTSPPDYNARAPFAPVELLEFRISDNGQTTRPQSGGVAILPDQRSPFATATITVAQSNDAPVFVIPSSRINILERDDSGATIVPGVLTGILPGPSTARDELALQTVSFRVDPSASTVPQGLMLQAPQIAPDGRLTVFPAPDAVGTAVYVFEAIDAELTDPNFVERRTRGTITIAVRPVNDAPVLDPAAFNSSQTLNVDEAWAVDGSGVITYTLKEDNTGPLGVTSPYLINVRRDPMGVGYQRIGLLDVFRAGPANEEDGTEGGPQSLRLLSFQARTALGGTIRAVGFANNQVTQLEYTPPTDVNLSGGIDSFTFEVQDDNPTDGETFNLSTGALANDRLSAFGTVRFRLNPVNDRPQFNVPVAEFSVLEDTGLFTFEDFVTDVFAGPPNTAFDETDTALGQEVRFSVSAVSSTAGLFSTSPTITPQGTLSFVTAPNAYGRAVLEIRATDNGDDNATRGDIVSSESRLITINVRPVNDRPVVNTTAPVSYTLNEDAAILNEDNTVTNRGTFIPLRGTGGVVGLLDVFSVGPANESANITPGGNQTLSLTTPIPTGTVNGGILTQERDVLGNLLGLRYTPRANFNGTDTFVYGVIDNGVTSDLDGNVTVDPREGFTTVTLIVTPRNDAPSFGGAPSVSVQEDATTTPNVGETIIPNWITNIQAGPAGAADELNPQTGQTVSFIVTPANNNPAGLFSTAPTISADGTLRFVTTRDANGAAVFTVVARDSGPSNEPLDINTSSPPRTFTITVSGTNDAPTFTAGADVVVDEDFGPFVSSTPYATNILPGPPDEVAAGQTVRFEVITPTSGQALFAQGGLPQITDNGFLRFTPADNASGSVVVTVTAIDSDGGRSAATSLRITITEINDLPVAVNDLFNGNEDAALSLPADRLLNNDRDPDLANNSGETLTIIDVPQTSLNGASVRLSSNGTILYDPRNAINLQALAPGQTRADTFTYRLRDAAGRTSNLATVTINVAGVNDAPTLLPDTPTLIPGSVLTFNPLNNDFDIDGVINALSILITQEPAFGSLEVRDDGTLVYTPFQGFRNQDEIRYTVADNLGLRSAEQTITIDVNQAPIAIDDRDGTFRNEAIDINVAGNDFDPDTTGSLDLNSVEIVTQPDSGSVIVLGGGLVRYLPDTGFSGSDSFQYTIRDNGGRASNFATVTLQVSASRLQNPRNFTDVNASGETSPIDALLIINRLAKAIRAGLPASIPVLSTDKGPDFFDVDGSQFITPADALRVINQIAKQNRIALSEGEAQTNANLVSAPPVSSGSQTTNTAPLGQNALSDTALTLGSESEWKPSFTTVDDATVAAITVNEEEEKKKKDSERLAAIDAAWADAASL